MYQNYAYMTRFICDNWRTHLKAYSDLDIDDTMTNASSNLTFAHARNKSVNTLFIVRAIYVPNLEQIATKMK